MGELDAEQDENPDEIDREEGQQDERQGPGDEVHAGERPDVEAEEKAQTARAPTATAPPAGAAQVQRTDALGRNL